MAPSFTLQPLKPFAPRRHGLAARRQARGARAEAGEERGLARVAPPAEKETRFLLDNGVTSSRFVNEDGGVTVNITARWPACPPPTPLSRKLDYTKPSAHLLPLFALCAILQPRRARPCFRRSATASSASL